MKSPTLVTVAGLCLLLFPVVSYARQRPARAALYALFLYGATVFITCTAFDLWDLTISGFERSIAYLMLPLIFTVVILYRQISAENASRTIRALSAEKPIIRCAPRRWPHRSGRILSSIR